MTVNLTPLLGFLPLEGQNFAGTANRSPHLETTEQTQHTSPYQANHTKDRDQHSEKAWSYKFQKLMITVSQAISKH